MIGILAGMGPKSTGPFIDQVVTSIQSMTGAKNDMDYPPMLIYSLPTPFYADRPIDHGPMQKTICAGLQKLESCGASFIAMPCNTAHIYFDALQGSIHIPLLNMIHLTLASIPPSAKRVTLLGTRPTLESEVYQKALEGKKVQCVLRPHWQNQIDEIISLVKSTALPSPHLLDSLFAEFKAEGIDTLLLVCTDLNVIFRNFSPPFQMVDSSLCLAKEIVNRWQLEKKR